MLVGNVDDIGIRSDGFVVSHYDYHWDAMNKKDDILKIVYLHASKELFVMQSDAYHRDLLEKECNYKLRSMRTRFVVMLFLLFFFFFFFFLIKCNVCGFFFCLFGYLFGYLFGCLFACLFGCLFVTAI